MGGIIHRTSRLDLDVRISPHPAPDNLGFSTPAHMNIIMAGLMDSQQIASFPVVVVSIDVVEVYPFFVDEF